MGLHAIRKRLLSRGLAALLAKANGNPIRTPYVFSRPEWTALVVPKDSPIKSLIIPGDAPKDAL